MWYHEISLQQWACHSELESERPFYLSQELSSSNPMPRATTEKFSRAHQPAAKKKDSQSSGSMTNPIFNTARFGQHILKNPATAQKWVELFPLGHFLTRYHRIVDAVSLWTLAANPSLKPDIRRILSRPTRLWRLAPVQEISPWKSWRRLNTSRRLKWTPGWPLRW